MNDEPIHSFTHSLIVFTAEARSCTEMVAISALISIKASRRPRANREGRMEGTGAASGAGITPSMNITPKYLTRGILLVLLLVAVACTDSEAQKVYITRTGEKYHKKDCRYLKYSSIEVELKEAKENGYTPCSVCRPVTTEQKPNEGTAGTHKPTPSQQSAPLYKERPPAKITSRQCTALTKAGSRCKRTTTNANGRCWQHQ